MTRLFIATWPPTEVARTVSAFHRPEIDGVRWSAPEQWMVTIRPLGHVDLSLAGSLVEALQAELDGAPAADCVLGPRTVRLGGQWLGAPVSGLDELGGVVFEASEDLVPVTHPQPFRTDLVLARGRVPKELAGMPISARWSARSVCLVADRSAPGVPRYEDLATIALEPPDA